MPFAEAGRGARGPLVGMRMLDVGTMIAGPFGATLLGDWGAEIVKIELPGHGDTFRTKDDKYAVIVCATDAIWQRLARSMERPDLLEDPRLTTNADRAKHETKLYSIIEEWVGSLTYARLEKRLGAHSVPVSKIYDVADIAADPHYAERGALVSVDDPQIGRVKMPNVFPRFSDTPGEIRHTGPALGQHNEEIYLGLLGMDAVELAELRNKGVV